MKMMKREKWVKFRKILIFVGLCAILASLSIGTASAENMIADTVADFNYINNNGDWHPNNWGGSFGLIYLGGCCTQSRDINIYHGCFGASLRLDYNVTKGFAGWYTKFQWSPTEYDKDLSDYEEFHFWVRGDPVNGCTSTFKVEFKDGNTTGEYIVDGVNSSWQEIIINLSYDVSPQPDWRKIDEFTIVFEDSRVTEKEGTLYVDDIRFIDTGNYYNTDNEFLDFVAEKAFMYFWETAQTDENTNQTSYGLIPDTTGNVGYATYDRKSSIAGNGFGLTALCIGAERGWISKSEAEERVYKTLLSHRNIQLKQSENSSLWGTYGFFYHFLDIHPDNGYQDVYLKRENYGQREGKTEVSSIDTALFIAGVITAGEYFGYNEDIKNLTEEIYSTVQWNKFFNTTLNQFYMEWKPEYKDNNSSIPAPDGGYFTYNNSTRWNGTWDTYSDEALLICLLAAGAPNESYRVPINNSFYSFNKRSWENCSYITYPYPDGTKIISSWTGSLFNYFFAHCWWDFRNKADLKNVNWWNNSVNAALANKYYCNNELKNKFQTYNDANCWGVTACSGNSSYLGKEAKPCWCCAASCLISGHPADEGTLAPYGAISCMPFFSSNKSENPSFQSLKYYVEKSDKKLWNQYGPVDSFNLGNNSSCEDDWYAPGYLAIDVGPMLIGIHNYRAMNGQNISSTYNWFMNNTHITKVDDATLNGAGMASALTKEEKIKLDADYILSCQYKARQHPAYGAINNVYGDPTWVVPSENAMAILGLIVASEVLNNKSYLEQAQLAADYLIKTQNSSDGAWYDKYSYRYNLDENASDWYIYEEGSSIGVKENVTTPSIDGNSLRCSITGGDPYSNVHLYRNFPSEPTAAVFNLSLSFWFSPPTTFNNKGASSIVQGLEFCMSKWYQSERYEFALQWQNVGDGAPQWRYWDPHQPEKWISLDIPDTLDGEQWHSFTLEGEIINKQIHYQRFKIDQDSYDINIIVPPISAPGKPDRLAVAIQLDGNSNEDPYDVFIDQVSFEYTDRAKSPRQTAEVMMGIYKLGYDHNRYNAMKNGAQYLMECQNVENKGGDDHDDNGLLGGGKDANGQYHSWCWTHDNSYAYWALKAAEDWAIIEDDISFASECANSSQRIMDGINTYLYDPATGVWHIAIDENGNPLKNPHLSCLYADADAYPNWIQYSPQMLDLPVEGVNSSKVGEWIHNTFQQDDGSCIDYWCEPGEFKVKEYPGVRNYPGLSFQASLCWFDTGHASHADAAVQWAENSGLWNTTHGGWVDWNESESGNKADDWLRFIDTSFYAIASWNGGYDFTCDRGEVSVGVDSDGDGLKDLEDPNPTVP